MTIASGAIISHDFVHRGPASSKMCSMKPKNLIGVLFIVFTIFGGTEIWFSGGTVTAQTSLPAFEVDKAWPKVPAKWKLGDASSFAIDAKDNVWLLHRPRTLKPDQAP